MRVLDLDQLDDARDAEDPHHPNERWVEGAVVAVEFVDEHPNEGHDHDEEVELESVGGQGVDYRGLQLGMTLFQPSEK